MRWCLISGTLNYYYLIIIQGVIGSFRQMRREERTVGDQFAGRVGHQRGIGREEEVVVVAFCNRGCDVTGRDGGGGIYRGGVVVSGGGKREDAFDNMGVHLVEAAVPRGGAGAGAHQQATGLLLHWRFRTIH